MILYKELEHIDSDYNSNLWTVLPARYKLQPDAFDIMIFRIDRVTYTEWSEEFQKAFEQDRIWRSLKRG